MNNMTSFGNSQLGAIAAAPLTSANNGRRDAPASWFEALANSWGNTLDNQAARIEAQADVVGLGGSDRPSDVAQLTAHSLRLSFLSQSSSSSIDSVGKALETMARKG
jgi:hypothetical protein